MRFKTPYPIKKDSKQFKYNIYFTKESNKMENYLVTETVLTIQNEKTPLTEISLSKHLLLPIYKDFIPLSCPTDRICECFTQVCKSHNFKISFTSPNKLIALFTPRFSFKRYFSCITGSELETISQVELQVKIMSFPNQKLIVAQGLQGSKTKLAILINAFKSELGKILINREFYFNDTPTFQRIQSEIWNFLATTNGREAIENLSNSLKAKFELRLIKSAVIQIIKLSYNHYPTSVKSQYLKALEQAIFAKFFKEIQNFYQEQSQDNEEKFKFQVGKLSSKENNELFDNLTFKNKFMLGEEKNPYHQPVRLLQELSKKIVPIEKLNVLHDVHIALKTSVLEYWKGKEELDGMDDILPLYIFIIIKAGLKNLPSEILMLQDYIRVSQDMESEERLVINYHVAVQYIINGCTP